MENIKNLFNLEQLKRYYLTGIILNILGFSIYILFTLYFEFKALTVIFFSQPVIFLIYFFFQNNYVFQVGKFRYYIFLKFLINFLIIYLLNLLLIFLSVEVFNLNHIYSQLIIIIILSLLNFIINKKITFRN